jgi:hypothetical protein
MVKTFNLFVALLAAGAVAARPIFTRDSGVDLSQLEGLLVRIFQHLLVICAAR